MSDLESVATSAPIISTAAGKLRRLSGNADRFGDTQGLVDAFAEVFAQMAITTPQPVPSQHSYTDTSQLEDEAAPQSDETENLDSQETSEKAPETNAAVFDAPPQATDPLVDQTIEIDSDLAYEVETVDSDNGQTVDALQPSQSPSQLPETSDPHVHAPAAEIETESKPIVQANVSASTLDGQPNRDGRREATIVNQPQPQAQDNQPIEGQPITEGFAAQSPSGRDGQDQPTPQHPSSQPPERTTRQQFLEARRDRTGDPDLHDNRAKQSQDSRAAEAVANQRVPSDVDHHPTQVTTPAPNVARPTTAHQAMIDSSQTSIANGAAKSPSNAAIGRTETRTTSQSVQPLAESRVEDGKGRGARPVADDASSMAARVKLVQRVSRAFQHLGLDGGVIRLRLAPAELGSVRVEMQINQRKVEARVVAETEAASAALKEHLPDLRARLESYGMQVERLEVETETRDPQSGLPFDRHSQQRESEQQHHRRPYRQDRQESSPVALRPSIQPTATLNPKLALGSVDLRL